MSEWAISAETKWPSADESTETNLNLKNASDTFTVVLNNPPIVDLAMLMGLPVVVLPKSLMCETIGFEQRRHHRKKRINKKWRKRYGLKPVYGPEKEAYYIQQNACGEDVLYVGPDTYKQIKDCCQAAR